MRMPMSAAPTRDAPDVDGYIFINTDEELMTGDFVRARVTGAYEYDLIGELLMNLPNKLTIMRVILIPFFVFFLLSPYGAGIRHTYIAVAIFIVASLTDMLDGKIARKYNLVTNFGKFMDPLADKLLVCSAMICLIELDRLAAWIVIVIISQRIYHQRFPSGGIRQRGCDRSKLLGKVQDNVPDADGDRSDP